MAVESATYISQLNTSYPLDGDIISEGDNHLRLVKSVLLAQFPSLGAAAVTPTAAQLNDVVNKAPIASPTLTGTPAAPTATAGASTTQIATTAFVQAAIAAVNAQTPLTLAIDASASVAAVVGQHVICTNAGTVTVTLPAAPTAGQRVRVTFTNALFSNVINPGSVKVFAVSGTRNVNQATATVEFVYVNATIGWVY